MGPQVTAAILIFILLQKSSSPLQSDRSSPLLSNLVPSQSSKCSWVSSESEEQSLHPMLFTWECLKFPLTPAIALALYLIQTTDGPYQFFCWIIGRRVSDVPQWSLIMCKPGGGARKIKQFRFLKIFTHLVYQLQSTFLGTWHVPRVICGYQGIALEQ